MDQKNIPLTDVFVSDNETTDAIAKMVRAGEVRKIGPRLYTRNMTDTPENVISKNIWQIVSLLAPGCVIGYRTAFEARIAADHTVFLTGRYKRRIVVPGLRIIQFKGAAATDEDKSFVGGLFMASQARFLLENLTATRGKEATPRSVGQEAVERRLVSILDVRGEGELNKIRNDARRIASTIGLEKEFKKLDMLVGALLRTQKTKLVTPQGRAYSLGAPYDAARMERFDALRRRLTSITFPVRAKKHMSGEAFFNESFYDVYFSNFIEGTEFEVDEAIGFVLNGVIPKVRPLDAHDILGTYRVVGSYDEMRQVPRDFESFLQLLQGRHATILEGRPDKRPGEFKEEANRAGSTLFVAPKLVQGTLQQGFAFLGSLNDSLARALFVMYLISEVHPFDDGNGRVARVMMNAELIAADLNRIIIPSVFRDEYIASLKLMSHHGDPSAFIQVMLYAQEFISSIDFSNMYDARATLERCNAFKRPSDNVKLKLP